ncbi:TPA: HNH endonuclease [Escherichia coli]|nr:HNH endonuclease [Escherichia coli]
MTRQELFEYVKSHWYLKDGIVYSKLTDKPVAFSSNHLNHFSQMVEIDGKKSVVNIHAAVFMLYHNRPIGEGMHIHHIDGNPLNNHPSNLVELTPKQHKRIHAYQCDDPLRGIALRKGAWELRWYDDDGRCRGRRFHEINEAMKFRAEIEEPYRAELRALGLDC